MTSLVLQFKKGDRNTFALEARIAERFSEYFCLGHLAIWLNGHEFGDWEDVANLIGSATWGLFFLEKRQDAARILVEDYSPRTLIYGFVGRWMNPRFPIGVETQVPVVPGDLSPGTLRARYSLTVLGEAALRDRAEVLALPMKGTDFDLVIGYEHATDGIESVELPSDELEQIILAYCDWVEGNAHGSCRAGGR